MSAKITASSDGTLVKLGTAAEDALQINSSNKTIKALPPYFFDGGSGSPINVLNYGAVGDATNDDTSAIQAAITANPGRRIFFPKGSYKITSPITISQPSTILFGEGPRTSNVVNFGTGDAFLFKNLSLPGGGLYGCGMNNMAVLRYGHQPAGSAVHLYDTSSFVLENVSLSEHFINYLLEGAKQTRSVNFSCYGGSSFTGGSGSAHIKLAPLPTYVSPNFIDAGWINLFDTFILSASLIVDSCIHITGGDEMKFCNAYVSGAKVAHALLDRQVVNVPFNTITFDTIYFDGIVGDDSATPYGIWQKPSTDLTNKSVDLCISACTFGQISQNAIFLQDDNSWSNVISGCEFHYIRRHALRVATSGIEATTNISGNLFHRVCTALDGSAAIRVVGAGPTNIVGNTFTDIASPGYAIRTTGTIPVLNVTGNTFYDCSTDLDQSASLTKYSATGNVSNSATSTAMGLYPGNVSNSNAQTLDWYEEGSLDNLVGVTFGGLSTGITYGNRYGSYTRIGNRVMFDIYITLTSKGSATGQMKVTGLPFAIDSGHPAALSLRINDAFTGVGTNALSALAASGTEVLFYQQVAGGSSQALDNTSCTNTTAIFVSGTYKV